MNNLNDVGYLKIENKDDRNTVAAILYANGYKVAPCRFKENGKTYKYYVKFQLTDPDSEAGDVISEV